MAEVSGSIQLPTTILVKINNLHDTVHIDGMIVHRVPRQESKRVQPLALSKDDAQRSVRGKTFHVQDRAAM